jgi:3-methyladenine DNA glycosylase/8-oxoguanine DNA glycosylase
MQTPVSTAAARLARTICWMSRSAPDFRWELATPAPFSLALTAQVLRRTARNVLDVWTAGTYARAVETATGDCLVLVRQVGSVDHGSLELKSSAAVTERSLIEAVIRRRLGLDADLSGLEVTLRADPALRPIAERLRGLRPPRFAGLVEAVGLTVPFQQLSLEAGGAIVNRLAQTFGRTVRADEDEGWLFPNAERLADASIDALQACGLSAAKAQTLRSAARLIADGSLSEGQLEALPTLEARGRLQELAGIGPWTADVILLRGLGRLDVFPRGDVSARRNLAVLLGRPTPLAAREEDELLARLGPARGMLYFYGLAWRRARQGVLDG